MPDRDVPRVLVVDDDARVRHFLTTALGAAGFAVTATGTGEEGLRLAAARPDLVVLDVDLPDLSGREVCRRLKVAGETASSRCSCSRACSRTWPIAARRWRTAPTPISSSR